MFRFFILFLIPLFSNGQYHPYREREILKNYKSYVVKYKFGCQKQWSEKNVLEDGLVIISENFKKNELRSKYFYEYNEKGNLSAYGWLKTKSEKTKEKDTIATYYYQYDDENKIVYKESSTGVIEEYSNFDKKGNPELILRKSNLLDTLVSLPYREELEYDFQGNIILEKLYGYTLSKITLREALENHTAESKLIKQKIINRYEYDQFNNVTKVERQYIPKRNFPIPMIEGTPRYALETFEYIYNSEGLWTKKFWIINNERKLVEKRKFLRKNVSKLYK